METEEGGVGWGAQRRGVEGDEREVQGAASDESPRCLQHSLLHRLFPRS